MTRILFDASVRLLVIAMRSNGFKICTIFGIEIFIDYSWFLIFFLITWLLAAKFYPSFLPDASVKTNIILGAITSFLFFTSTLLHELAHSLTAKKNGLKVSRITLFLFGGIAELFDEPKDAVVEFKVAVMGPVLSLFLAMLLWLVFYLLQGNPRFAYPALVASTVAEVNLLLAMFNLLPGFPLDGGRILRSIIWIVKKNFVESTKIATITGKVIAIAIIVTGITRVLTTDFYGGVWLVMIGVFLYQAAGQSYLELLIKEALKKTKIKEVMKIQLVAVSPFLSINELVEEYFLKNNHRTLPVVVDDRIIGIVSLDDVRDNSNDLDDSTKVIDVMRRMDNCIYFDKEDKVLNALKDMIATKVNFVSVLDQNQLVGVLTLDDIANYLTEKKVI